MQGSARDTSNSSGSAEISRIFGTRCSFTAFTVARHITSLGRSIQSMNPPPTCIIFFSHPRISRPRLFPSGCHTKTLYAPPLPPPCNSCHVPGQAYSSWFDYRNNMWWWQRSWSISFSSLRLSFVTSSLLGPNIFLSNLLSNYISLLKHFVIQLMHKAHM